MSSKHSAALPNIQDLFSNAIWLAFDYRFNALAKGEEENELNRAFSAIFSSNMEFSIITFLRLGIPSLRWVVIIFCIS